MDGTPLKAPLMAEAPPVKPRRKHGAKGGLSTSEFAEAVGRSSRTVERWVEGGRIVPAFRTKGGHSRFNQAQVEAQKKQRQRSPYWQKIGPNGESLGERGVQPGTAQVHSNARRWAQRMRFDNWLRQMKKSRENK